MELSFQDSWYYFLIAAIACYFVGCFNFAVLISRIRKNDVRHIGSGNPGTMNMARSFGFKIGVINFVCDALKGGIPVLVGYLIFRNYVFAGTNVLVSDFARYFFGIFVIIGHIFPVTMKFKGGKGIASTFGMFWVALSCEQWWYFFIGFLVFLIVFFYIYFTEWGSMGSLFGVTMYSVWQLFILYFRYENELTNIWVILILVIILIDNLLTWLAHNKNLYRLMAGEEHRTSVKKMLKKKKKN